MKRILIYIAVFVVVLVLLAAAAWWWLTSTHGGAAWLLGQVETRVEQFGYARLEGDLSDELILESVDFSQAGLSASIDRLALSARVRLLPLRVTIVQLDLDGVDLTLPPPGPEDPEAGPFEPGDYSAPVEVLVRQLEITDLNIRSHAGEELAQVRQFNLSGRYAESLTIESLVLDIEPWRLTASGEQGLSAPWQSELDLALDWAVDTDTTQRLNARLRGPLDDLDLALEAQGPLSASGQVDLRGLPAIDSLSAGVALQGELAGWPGLDGRIDEIELSADGDLDDWQAELAGRVAWPGQPTARLDLAAIGDRNHVRIERGDVDVLDGRVGVTGELSLDPALATDADIVLEGLDFTGLYPEWPDQARLSGSMAAVWDGRELVVDKLDLRAPPVPMELTGRASLDVDTQALDVVLEWQSLVWPPVLDQSEPLFSSESGRLEAGGTLDEWRAEVEAWLALPEQPRAWLEVRADGNAEMANIRSGSLRVDQAGELRIRGTAGFGADPSADLALSLVDFDPGFAVPELRGSINGELTMQLDQLDPLVARLSIERLGGQLRDLPLQGSGALSARGNQVEQADLGLSLGDNRLDLTSDSASQWQVDIDAVRLEQLWPGLDGSVGLQASIDPAAHSATWTLQSPGASWLDYRTAQVESSGSMSWGDRPNIEAVFEAVDVDLNPWERLDQFEIRLSGDCSGHRLESDSSGTRATLELAITGRLPDCLETPLRWDGQIETLALSDTPMGAWQLAEPLPVAIDPTGITAGPGCLWTVAS
ncbi:MAG: hypothetical protein LC637_13430, partial [Xanthomonadaceae bacterium]|nr:hypothetical protein [Xanthomonadaceae bacterium]